MPETEIPDFDHSPVICSERVARIKFGKPAIEHGLPVGAYIHDFAVEAGAGDPPADNGNDASLAGSSAAQLGDRAEFHFEISDMAKVRVWQHGLSCMDVDVGTRAASAITWQSEIRLGRRFAASRLSSSKAI
jgi:hypothetical protein